MSKNENSIESTEPLIPRIEFRDVYLFFDDEVVLDHVSFTVAPGEMKVLLGESGGGKSTAGLRVLHRQGVVAEAGAGHP